MSPVVMGFSFSRWLNKVVTFLACYRWALIPEALARPPESDADAPFSACMRRAGSQFPPFHVETWLNADGSEQL
ncbi:hypothetical protein EYF80_026767 [Liparis tanakae]|uniref:Uncharacterized protein n=1 Tax=Liparis tanakae TaxID=230148 RepID=A0A4Z2HB42_9TELE|nr:hypothetical protein EYF80_026767 [Liparis tanakae]